MASLSLDNGIHYVSAINAVASELETNWDLIVQAMDPKIREAVHAEFDLPMPNWRFLHLYFLRAKHDIVIG